MLGAGSTGVVLCVEESGMGLCKHRLEDSGGIFSIARKNLPCATHSDDANIEVAQGDHEAAQS